MTKFYADPRNVKPPKKRNISGYVPVFWVQLSLQNESFYFIKA